MISEKYLGYFTHLVTHSIVWLSVNPAEVNYKTNRVNISKYLGRKKINGKRLGIQDLFGKSSALLYYQFVGR